LQTWQSVPISSYVENCRSFSWITAAVVAAIDGDLPDLRRLA